MKRSLLFLTLFPVLSFGQLTQHELGFYLPISIPSKTIMPKMSVASGLGWKYSYQPFRFVPISLQVGTSFQSYSNRTLDQNYYFSDGSVTNTSVTYSSNMTNMTFGTRFRIGKDYAKYNAFITPMIGTQAMRSRIVIADPQDEDGCEALDRETVYKFRGGIYGIEAGVSADLNTIWRGLEEGKHRLNISTSLYQSFGNFSYINVKYMKDHDHALMSGGEVLPITEDGRTDLNATFINVSTQELHEHKIAEVYNTAFKMWQIQIGYSFRF